MTLSEFRTSVSGGTPPETLSLPLQALWWDAKGGWHKAHECAQADPGPDGAAVHACAAGILSIPFANEVYTYQTPIPGCAPP